MKGGHVMRGQQHDIIFCRVEMAVSSIDDARLRQGYAAFSTEIRNHKFMLLSVFRLLVGSGLGEDGLEGDDEEKDQFFHVNSAVSSQFLVLGKIKSRRIYHGGAEARRSHGEKLLVWKGKNKTKPQERAEKQRTRERTAKLNPATAGATHEMTFSGIV